MSNKANISNEKVIVYASNPCNAKALKRHP